jgi:hypothetical protein
VVIDARATALSRTLPLLGELLAQVEPTVLDQHLATFCVRLVVDAHFAASGVTQVFITTLAGLVARSGMRFQLDSPSADFVAPMPGMAGTSLTGAIAAAMPMMFPGARLDDAEPNPGIAVVLGHAASPLGPDATIRLSADGRSTRLSWGGRLGDGWLPANELVALAAAGLASMEIHKAALRCLPSRTATAAELLTPSDLEFTVPFELPAIVRLGWIDVISAGAICQNAIWTFAAIPGLTGQLRIIEGDVVELSNANRCPFVYLDRIGWAKVDLLGDLLPDRIRVERVPRHFRIDDLNRGRLAPIALVGADDIAVRHWVQAGHPDLLVIGATSHFEVVVSEHRARTACAGCIHPRVGDAAPIMIPTASFVSFWAGYLSALRVIASRVGVPYGPAQQLTVAFPLQLAGSWTGAAAIRSDCPVGHSQTT